MKRWWNTVVKDYFTFTRKDRRAIVIMLVAIAGIFLLGNYYPVNKTAPVPPDAFQQELAQLNITIDTARSGKRYYATDDEEGDNSHPAYERSYAKHDDVKGELFAFDPNTLDAEGWKRLGIREKTIGTIQKLLGKGFRFREAEDIRKVYGIWPDQADRLFPYVHIADVPVKQPDNSFVSVAPIYPAKPAVKPKLIVDVANADTSQFIALYGIGSKLAARIVNFRDKLGGFYSVDQVGETWGLPDSTFKSIKSQLQLSSASVKKININTAGVDELKSHPYIRWNVANAIVNYRQQHGSFGSVEDLRKIAIITDEMYEKMVHYLTI